MRGSNSDSIFSISRSQFTICWLIDAIQISRLTEGKQMLGPPVAFQGFSEGLRVGFDVWILQIGEFVAYPDVQPGWHPQWQGQSPRNVTDDVMDLQVHLGQRLVHVLHGSEC
jgi:hypothetical protein